MKVLLSALFIIISFGQISAQQFYLKFMGGYGIGTSPETIISSYTTDNDERTNTFSKYDADNFSFGKGFSFNITPGYSFNDIIGVELELGYLKSEAVYQKQYFTMPSITDNLNIGYNAASFNIIPSVVLKTSYMDFQPYLKIGAIFAFSSVDRTVDEYYTNNTPMGFSSLYHFKYEYTGGLAMGISSALGVSYKVTKDINVLFEINNKNLSFSPTKGELTEATANGVTFLPQYPNTGFDFSESTDTNSSKQIKKEYPFSGLSFLVGFSVQL